MNNDYQSLGREPQVISDHKTRNIIIATIVIVTVGVVVWLALPSKNNGNTSFKELSGIQGVITSIDGEGNEFNLKQVKLLRSANGVQTQERDYLVIWDDNTEFYTYAQIQDIRKSNSVTGDSGLLAAKKTVVVNPSGKVTKDSTVLNALQIYIIP